MEGSLINFNDYYYFAQVVENRGITAASRALKLPKSKLSRRVSELEARLGARLIQRTSRSFVVTELGEELYEHARKMIDEARAAETAVKCRLDDQTGTIRLAISQEVSRLCFAEIIPGFLRKFPNVRVVKEVLPQSSELSNRLSDLFIVSHNQNLVDSSMIQRSLLVEPLHLFAARSYLESAGVPRSHGELADHAFIGVAQAPVETEIELVHEDSGTNAAFQFKPRLVSDEMCSVAAAVRAGAGIAALPNWLCREELLNGEVVHLLPGWTAGTTTISALLPSRKGVLPAVRSLLDYMCRQLPTTVTASNIKMPAVELPETRDCASAGGL